MKGDKRTVIILTIMVVIITSMTMKLISEKKKDSNNSETEKNTTLTGNFNIDLIKKINDVNKDKNYLISPYNIEIALNMLREGSLDKTKEEFDKVLGDRKINNVSVKDKVGIANAIFIKDEYKDNVKKDYYNILNTKYNSEVLYDKFTSPDKINNWVKEKTNGMIEKVLDDVHKDFVMGLASALAIDVKWLDEFECNNTRSEEFIGVNNEKIDVQMMHKTYETGDYKYFKNDDASGIIIPYRQEENSDIKLEFVGILPTISIFDYIENLTKEKMDSIDKNIKVASEKLHINLSLPRFKYDFELKSEDFISVLKNIGIKEAFDRYNANFKKMIEINDYNVYVGEAIHKTHIDLNEKGTKAAAITYLGMFKATGMIDQREYENIDIKFNKPFIYMIREKNTGEILFFGTVFEPNKWNGSTCSTLN